MNNTDQDELSDALISELRLIAEGKFELGDEKVMVSSRLSSIKESKSPDKEEQESVKSNRINVLSLGAYTVAIPERGDFAA